MSGAVFHNITANLSHNAIFLGSARASRAGFGALAETFFD